MSPNAPSGGLSLFPNTSGTKPPSRKTTPKPRTSHDKSSSVEMSPPRNDRRTPENPSEFVVDGSPQMGSNSQVPPQPNYEIQAGPSVARVIPVSEVPPRTDTALSGASTLVRSSSNRSRSSIAKRPFEEVSSSQSAEEAGIRSMFPQYDHSRPFDQQNYFPTQTSPRHIPRTVISRQSHTLQEIEIQSPPMRSPMRSPLSAGSAQRWPRRNQDPPVIPPVSRTEELRDYWKAANGWKASSTEGRTYCMKLTPEKDTPIYHISSATQPFYHLRIDPTSASAYVTLSRHDPSKPCKEKDPQVAAKGPSGILGALREPEGNKTWQEVISTALEEPSRRLPPNDGLVALLYPTAAAKIALDRPGDAQAVAMAERECARLVWDGDSANYFLAHPALATPFCVTVERNAAWSRTEYALEHIESPRHLARLTRETRGSGDGFLELDTLVAGRVDAHYVLDVAVCALLLVAHLDERNALVEQFEPPPLSELQPPLPAHLRDDGGSAGGGERRSTSSRLSGMLHMHGGKNKDDNNSKKGDNKKKKGGKRRWRLGKPAEEFELDLESQSQSSSNMGPPKSYSGGGGGDKKDNKLPGTTRTVIKLLSISFKCVIWALTLGFKALCAVVVGLSKCLTSEKL
ncbi:hypothetical protein DL764_008320 [Monosporascus ibericus]|uniref:Acetylserotonin methytransferase-like protein n=1 Tax=Monosporascus ibericus TaxID=155417 RepID=A0A4Q4SXT3_9PEZI|nr:hypothetical protein DL764_008320 [Monosporascus ibericus]